MKKLMMFAAALTCAGVVWAQTVTVVPDPVKVSAPVGIRTAPTVTIKSVTNAWAAPIQVVQTAAKIKLSAININTMPDGKIAVIVQWAWLDANDKIVRSGVTRYSEAQIAAKLVAKGASIDAFRQLFLAIAAEEAVAP